eukprot:COSAG01_NODE_3660_length_5817_cov_28.686604_5_plen_178_part_00
MRLLAFLLNAFCYMVWLSMVVIPPETLAAAFWTGMATVVVWFVAACFMHGEAEQCRKAVLKNWEDWQPIHISAASVAQLAAAAHAKGMPYFTAAFVQLLWDRQVDGEVLNAVLEAEQTNGPDSANARQFFDEMFQGLSVHHKIAAKGILREWVSSGVPPQPQLMEPELLGTVVSVTP